MQTQYSQETIQKEADQTFINLDQLMDCKGWNQGEKVQKHMVYKLKIGDRVAVKGDIILGKPYEKVVEFFSDPYHPKKLNDNMTKFDILKKKEGKWLVVHGQMEGVAIVSGRQMINVAVTKVEENKAIFGARSLQNYPMPQNSDYIRAHATVVGFIIEKIAENETKVTSISDLDMKGSFPQFLQNKLANRRTQALSKLVKMI